MLIMKVHKSKGAKMSKLSKMIWSIINHVPAIGMYALLLIVNAFSQSTYLKSEENKISQEG
jgi:monomeric isocitrate dehydrogenase